MANIKINDNLTINGDKINLCVKYPQSANNPITTAICQVGQTFITATGVVAVELFAFAESVEGVKSIGTNLIIRSSEIEKSAYYENENGQNIINFTLASQNHTFYGEVADLMQTEIETGANNLIP